MGELRFCFTGLSNMHRCCAFPIALAGLFLFAHLLHDAACMIIAMRVFDKNGTTLSAQQYRPLTSTRQHGWQTYQTVAAPYPAYLLHFL